MTSGAEFVAPRAPGSNGDVQVSCHGVWKVFGPNAAKVIESGDVDLPRAELMAKTGCTVASRDISFDVGRGEVFVIMGLSGSGKSTLVRCVTRLIEPTSGAITICGQDVLGADPRSCASFVAPSVSMVFQHFGLFPHRNVIDNVAYGLEVQGIDKTTRHDRARELLGVVGLSSVEASYPDELSGGMQQRVGLARALAVDPEVLIFDEAFSALDPLIRREMQDEVLRLQERLHKTVIFVTHDLDEALKLGDRIAIMKDGRFVQVGTPAEIVGAPADDYVREFVRDVPRGEVLTAAFATQPHTGGESPEDVVRHDQRLGELLPVVFGAQGPIGVVDGGGRARRHPRSPAGDPRSRRPRGILRSGRACVQRDPDRTGVAGGRDVGADGHSDARAASPDRPLRPTDLAAARRLDARLGGLGRWLAPVAVAVPLCAVAAIAGGVHSGFPSDLGPGCAPLVRQSQQLGHQPRHLELLPPHHRRGLRQSS